MLAIIRVRLGEKPIEFSMDMTSGLPKNLVGDEGRVRQILLNILSNAVKYTNNGFIKFFVAWERIAENSVQLIFTVEDSGVGIKPEGLSRLFKDFTRIDDEHNAYIEGTGLGLTIARSLCRAMDGDITSRSVYGEGSTFIATVMQGVVDWNPVGDIAGKASEHQKIKHIGFTAPDVRVLIVDDIASNLLVAEGLLLPHKMDIITCLSGREAVSLVREQHFDLVLMDHMMPDMDGMEAVSAIRAINGSRYRDLPIVALTANAVWA